MGHDVSKHRHGKSKSSVPLSSSLSNTTGAASTNMTRNSNLSNFAVITVIFNPVKYNSRYEHYRKFVEHMSRSGVNLYTVECIFESAPHFGLPRQNFEITRAGDPYHIQLVAPSIIWMKENLINVAVQRLPQNVEYIAWLDADIEFERLDWPNLAINELQRYPIVQLFELAYFLGPGGKKDILRRDYSFGYSIRHNKPIKPGHADGWYAHPGYAWAMRRSAFKAIGGLIDFCIIGSGDLHFAFALLHRIEETLRPGLHQDYQALALSWGDTVANVAQNGTNVSYVPVNLWHHWHGERKDRGYVDRWAILERHGFSPLDDLEKNDQTGLLRLADKRNFGRPELVAKTEAFERDIVAYFRSRNEDNHVKAEQGQRPPPVKARAFVAAKTQPHRGGGLKTTAFPPHKGTSNRPHLWTSGPSGTHVDYEHPYWDQCTCPGHHHHDNHNCPCSSHTDDQHCWDSSGNEHHHHHPDDHHHHHDTDDQHCWDSSGNEHHHHHPDDHHHHHDTDDHHHHHDTDDHHHHHTDDHHGGHHDDCVNVDYGGHHYDHSSGGGYDHSSGGGYDHSSGGGYDYHSGGGSGHTGYDGPGSFY